MSMQPEYAKALKPGDLFYVSRDKLAYLAAKVSTVGTSVRVHALIGPGHERIVWLSPSEMVAVKC